MSELNDAIHLTWIAAQMNDKDRPRFWSQHRPKRVDGDVLSITIDVGKDRSRSAHSDAARGGKERAAAGHDVITRSNANRTQRQFEGNGSVSDCNSVLRSASIRKFALKQPSLLAGAVVHFSTAHHIGNGGNLVLRKDRPLRHRLSPHRHAAVKSQGSFENSWIHINIQIGKIENGSGILSELRF